jgi:hypothetical protein
MQQNVVDLKELYNYDEFDKIITYLRDAKLESIGSNIISKTITKLHQIENPEKLVEVLVIFAKYKLEVFINEIKEGIRILCSMGYF